MTELLPPDTTATEPKVKASSRVGAPSGAVVGVFVAWILETYIFRGPLPEPVVGIIYLAVPAVLSGIGAFIAGRRAKHQYRQLPT